MRLGKNPLLSRGTPPAAAIVAACLLVGACLPAAHADPDSIHVSISGSDTTGDGSPGNPFQSIQTAVDLAGPGTTVWIASGTYRESFRVFNDGLPGSEITIRSMPGEGVVISGTEAVPELMPVGDGRYRFDTAGQEVEQVFINGQLVEIARWPDSGGEPLKYSQWASASVSGNKVTFSGVDWPDDRWVGAFVVICARNRWITTSGDVVASSRNQLTVNNVSGWYDSTYAQGEGRAYVIHHPEALDSPNEWTYDDNGIVMIPPVGFDPDSDLVEVKTREYGAILRDVSHIVIDGIDFIACSADLSNATHTILRNSTFTYPRAFWRFRDSWNRENDPSGWSNGFGIRVSGSNNLIENCEVRYSWGDGITVTGSHNTVRDCLVEDVNWIGLDCAPVVATGEGHLIEHNTVRESGRSGILHRQLKNGIIRYNDISKFGYLTSDLGGTYTYMDDGRGTIIEHNWIHDHRVADSDISLGIFLDNGSANFVVRRNVLWNTKGGIHFNPDFNDSEILHNTIWGLEDPGAVSTAFFQGKTYWNILTANNLSDRTFVGNDLTGNISTLTPRFVAPELGHFGLLSDSPAIDAGSELGLGEGYSGYAPDAGAYELGTAFWSAGRRTGDPSAYFNTLRQPAIAGRPVEFDSRYSVATGDGPLTVEWQLDSGFMGDAEVLTHKFNWPGMRELRLMVTDANGRQAQATHTFEVLPVADSFAFNWLGYWTGYAWPWIWTSELGWVYAHPVSEWATWLYLPQSGWVYVSIDSLPYTWLPETGWTLL